MKTRVGQQLPYTVNITTRLLVAGVLWLFEEITKRLKPSDFREIRPARTQTSDKTLLLTIRVRNFERGSRVQRYASAMEPGQTILDGDLIFSNKETGKVLYTHRMSYETIGGFLSGASYKGAAEHIVKIIQVKKSL